MGGRRTGSTRGRQARPRGGGGGWSCVCAAGRERSGPGCPGPGSRWAGWARPGRGLPASPLTGAEQPGAAAGGRLLVGGPPPLGRTRTRPGGPRVPVLPGGTGCPPGLGTRGRGPACGHARGAQPAGGAAGAGGGRHSRDENKPAVQRAPHGEPGRPGLRAAGQAGRRSPAAAGEPALREAGAGRWPRGPGRPWPAAAATPAAACAYLQGRPPRPAPPEAKRGPSRADEQGVGLARVSGGGGARWGAGGTFRAAITPDPPSRGGGVRGSLRRPGRRRPAVSARRGQARRPEPHLQAPPRFSWLKFYCQC